MFAGGGPKIIVTPLNDLEGLCGVSPPRLGPNVEPPLSTGSKSAVYGCRCACGTVRLLAVRTGDV